MLENSEIQSQHQRAAVVRHRDNGLPILANLEDGVELSDNYTELSHKGMQIKYLPPSSSSMVAVSPFNLPIYREWPVATWLSGNFTLYTKERGRFAIQEFYQFFN